MALPTIALGGAAGPLSSAPAPAAAASRVDFRPRHHAPSAVVEVVGGAAHASTASSTPSWMPPMVPATTLSTANSALYASPRAFAQSVPPSSGDVPREPATAPSLADDTPRRPAPAAGPALGHLGRPSTAGVEGSDTDGLTSGGEQGERGTRERRSRHHRDRDRRRGKRTPSSTQHMQWRRGEMLGRGAFGKVRASSKRPRVGSGRTRH